MQTLTDIKRLLAERGLSPRHSLGQNFLIDQNLVRRLVDAAQVAAGDLVVEVGPGTGVLTDELLLRGAHVIACELDDGLAALLRERLMGKSNFSLIEGDCLAGKRGINADIIRAVGDRRFKLIANLPYAAASPLMGTLATDHPACTAMFVTIQREVADRLRAKPGTKEYGELGIVIQAMAEIEKIAALPPECFWPRPKVASEMVAIRRRTAPLTSDPERLMRLCHALFSKRRKQIGTILGRRVQLPEGVQASQRPEELSVEQLVRLSDVFDEQDAPGDE